MRQTYAEWHSKNQPLSLLWSLWLVLGGSWSKTTFFVDFEKNQNNYNKQKTKKTFRLFVTNHFIFIHCRAQEVDKFGIQKVVEMAMSDADPRNDRDYHISFDIDVLDRLEAPSTGYACTHFPHRLSILLL